MNAHRAFQSGAAPSQQAHRRTDIVREPVQLLTEAEAAGVCRYFDRGCANPVRAFQKWARREGIPVKYVGRKRLYDPRVLSAFLEREPWTNRHRIPVHDRHGRARTA